MFKKRKLLIDTVKNVQFSISSLKIAVDNQGTLLDYCKDELTELIRRLQKGSVDLAPYNKKLHNKKSITTSVGYFELPQEPFVISKPHTDVELNIIILKSHTEPTYVEVWCKDKDETNLIFSKLLSIYGCTQLN